MTKDLVVALILASIFLFTSQVILVPVFIDQVFASGTESFTLINGMLLTTNHPITNMLGENFFHNIIININGGLVNAHYSVPTNFGDKKGSYDCTVTIDMEGTYSSDAGMKGQYKILINGSAVYEGKPAPVNFSPSGPFSGPGGLVVGKTVTVAFSKAVGPPAEMFGRTISANLDPFEVRFTVASPGAPGPVVKSLPPIYGEPMAFVEKIEGAGPVYVSNESEDVPPSQRNWVVATPKMSLGKNYSVRTGTNAEVILRWNCGAVSRTKSASSLTIKEATDTRTGLTTALTRMYQGISNFYFPKGSQGAEKFGIEVDRAVVGIKGTNVVIDVSAGSTYIKVLEGIVEVKLKSTGETISLESGKSLTVADAGLGQKSTFDAAAEKAKWGDMTISGAESSSTTSQSDTSGGSSTKKKPGISLPKCPITSALEVDPSSPRLTIFRNFRDKVLTKSEPGREFIGFYYGTGSWVVDNVLSNNAARFLTRKGILEPLSLAITGSAFIWNN